MWFSADILSAWNEAHGQAGGILFHGLHGEVVGLLDGADSAALTRTNREPRQQGHQDGLCHHHSDVLSDAGPRAAAERLEVTTGNLRGKRAPLRLQYYSGKVMVMLYHCVYFKEWYLHGTLR